jgi:hypothetical protein
MRAPWGRRAARAAVLAGAVSVAAGAVALWGQARQATGFPHALHEGLFPVCTGCHTGVPTGDPASMYPSAELCTRCHDDDQQPRVSWSGPTEEIGNLRFEHPRHVELLQGAGDEPVTCEACHSAPGRGRMAVDADEELATCFSCHAHETADHYATADCSTCHQPLAETRFGTARIAALPVPTDHDATSFLEQEHGRAARGDTGRCATCHTVERCLACHVDGQRRAIRAMPAAPSGMTLPPAVAHYPMPDSHTDEGWLSAHGRQAEVRQCNTCHTRDDCTVCHVQPLPDLVMALPERMANLAPGVMVVGHPPESHASPFFLGSHTTLAASDVASCNTCHTQTFCTECHEAATGSGNAYHPPDFVARHPALAFNQDAECSTCHNTAVFCRTCHVESGLGADGRLGQGYHTAEPMWLLRHGQAARQNLESCASCHTQRDCTQCHGVLGAFKVNPHGRDFDADAAWKRNPRTCFACHIRNPVEGGGP